MEIQALEKIALEAVSGGPAIKYEDHDDDVGCFACCGELSYHPHEKGCWFPAMVNELRRLGHAV